MSPRCLADGRPACTPETLPPPPPRARRKLSAHFRTRAVSSPPALPSPRQLGCRSMSFPPECHLKGQGWLQKSRSMATLNCLCPTPAQLFPRLLNYSQGTQRELLWGHRVHQLRLCTATFQGPGVPLTQTTRCTNCMTVGGRPSGEP